MIRHHAPDEACQFSCYCSLGYICFLGFSKDHFVITASQTLVRFVRICNNLRRISFLSCFKSFGLVAHLSSRITLSCLCKQKAYMAVSSFGDTKSVLVFGAGILTRNNSKIRRKVLCICKTIKVTNLNNYR